MGAVGGARQLCTASVSYRQVVASCCRTHGPVKGRLPLQVNVGAAALVDGWLLRGSLGRLNWLQLGQLRPLPHMQHLGSWWWRAILGAPHASVAGRANAGADGVKTVGIQRRTELRQAQGGWGLSTPEATQGTYSAPCSLRDMNSMQHGPTADHN